VRHSTIVLRVRDGSSLFDLDLYGTILAIHRYLSNLTGNTLYRECVEGKKTQRLSNDDQSRLNKWRFRAKERIVITTNRLAGEPYKVIPGPKHFGSPSRIVANDKDCCCSTLEYSRSCRCNHVVYYHIDELMSMQIHQMSVISCTLPNFKKLGKTKMTPPVTRQHRVLLEAASKLKNSIAKLRELLTKN